MLSCSCPTGNFNQQVHRKLENVITGYNTDVDYGGVTYHVQTEDKGVQTPVILTLVYAGGAILASKRSPYDDLIRTGFDEKILTTRLQRQHKLICAAVHAGRIDDLRRMSEREAAADQTQTPATRRDIDEAASSAAKNLANETTLLTMNPAEPGLSVDLVNEQVFHGGETVTLRLLVSRPGEGARQRAAARVKIKTLGSTFSPQSVTTSTDERGVAEVTMKLPEFQAGRAAVLVTAESHGETAELRRIILPAQ